jgi:hypothetical protein
MKKVIKLKESDLIRIIQRVMSEQSVVGAPNYGTTNSQPSTKPNKPEKTISSLSCVPLAFQLAVDKLIKEGYDKKILKTSLGIIGRESDFGESNRFKFFSPLKFLFSRLGVSTSVGYGQIKPDTAKEFGMTTDDLITSIGSLKTVYQILQKNYNKAIEVGYTNQPSTNYNSGTGDSALDISILSFNKGYGSITKYCETSNPKIKKSCKYAGQIIKEQSIFGGGQGGYVVPPTPKKIKVFNKHVLNYLPNFKTQRWDGVNITSHGYVKEVADRIKKYTCF